MEVIRPDNLNKAYKAVVRNNGCGGIDKMSCEQLLTCLLPNKDELMHSFLDGHIPSESRQKGEMPKDNVKMRLLGIPTTLERFQQRLTVWCNKPSTKC